MVVQSFLVAAVVVGLVAWGGGILYRRMRDRADRAEAGRDTQRAEIAAQFALPTAPDPAQFETPGAAKRAKNWRKRFHAPAIVLKNRYYEFLGRCGVLLAFLFILTALDLTVLRSANALGPYFAAIDVLGALYVLVHWWRSKIVNQDWILTRIQSELMRQWLQMVFAFGWSEAQVAAGYEGAVQRIETDILTPKSRIKQRLGFGLTSEDLEPRIEAYRANLSREMARNLPTQPPADWRDRLVAYLHTRAAGQLQWFRMRGTQFAGGASRRAMVTTLLFFATFLLAVINVLLVDFSVSGNAPYSDVLNLLLLIAMAISAALTYWYVSRNERSIGYRYGTQRRHIEAWLRSISTAVARGDAAPAYGDVLELEALITSELIDWVHVTSHDIISL